MNDTNFVNCTGLDDSPEAQNHRTSAYDIALMSRELLVNHPGIKNYTTIWMDTIRDGAFGLSNTNKLVRFYSGATGLKTGFTSGAGYCLSATAQRDGMELIAVVMGAKTSGERNAACKQLLDMGFANYTVVSPQPEGEVLLPVKLGTAELVRLVPGERQQLLIDKARKSNITAEVTHVEDITAPVARGQRLGTLTVRSGEDILAEIPMVAETEVARLNWGELFSLVVRKIAMGG
jgi:D-alanyl-D-alanine carboxypeptidase (penicillin-binding protein 5/6)